MLISILFMMTSMSLLFMFLNHPLSFGLILLIETLMVAVVTGILNFNFWFSYILFLIMVGGMLILFIYMTSVASNEKFKLSYKLTLLSSACIMIALSASFLDPAIYNMSITNNELMTGQALYSLSMTKYMNLPTNLIMFMVISYLLVTLIMVVKITNVQYGPLRQKF
uniref:NADH-ubiquinone oxidoreductase chain 6 n=1 Tax=Chrysomeloidea sp. 5 KM-2017 TaxID=2219299 RepID=A0A346RIS1_9CUCU|nr:NADH dehydrogenase subunit 6 [Chrysomeloidea sp. 5 KM-2017]